MTTRQPGSKYDDIIQQTRRATAEGRTRSAVSRRALDALAGTFWLTFGVTFIVGMVATSIGALANIPIVIALGGIAMALWLILLIGWGVVGLVRRNST